MLGACSSCRLRCSEKLDEQTCAAINQKFWEYEFSERRLWLDSHINIYTVKRHRGKSLTKRKHSLTYTLPKGTEKIAVCKKMFMKTLGMRTDGMITKFVNAKERSNKDAMPMNVDQRGKTSPPNKANEEAIRSHINSYHPQLSHYNLMHSPNRRYLESSLSIVG